MLNGGLSGAQGAPRAGYAATHAMRARVPPEFSCDALRSRPAVRCVTRRIASRALVVACHLLHAARTLHALEYACECRLQLRERSLPLGSTPVLCSHTRTHARTRAHTTPYTPALCARALGCVRSSRRLSAFVIGCVRACRAAARGGDDLRVVRRAAAAVRAGHAGFQYYDDGL
jgi:hypothetical protein